MKVAVSGAGGLVGSHLLPVLSANGHEVLPMVRSAPWDSQSSSDSQIYWNPGEGQIDARGLSGVDAVIHLAGENVAQGRWNPAKKHRIRESRVAGTKLICDTLAGLDSKPHTIVCASAIGFYGDHGDDEMTETSLPGRGFLADVCRDWEDSCRDAREAGIRVVNARIGVVLSPEGGALAKMLGPFKMGVGGIVGSGRQFWSWVSIEDVVRALHFALIEESLAGPVNIVSPEPVRNSEFTRTLGQRLRRPTILPMPALAAKVVLGQMAEDLLLSSTRVLPIRLVEAGYEFRHPTLDVALSELLDR